MTAPASIEQRVEREVQRQVQRFRTAVRGVHPRECPICGYRGLFTAFGFPPRYDARCGQCQSLERHRLFALTMSRTALFSPDDVVLHFAPEGQLTPLIRSVVGHYETADLSERRQLTHRIDIESTGLPDESYDKVICNHVIEHVDDALALREVHRILRPGGSLILSTPIVEGWAETYENPSVTSTEERRIHFGQADHVRLYGRDLRDRIRTAGFDLSEVTAVEPDVLTYGLMRGETLFIATKPAQPRPTEGSH